jgi:hypothetical protein
MMLVRQLHAYLTAFVAPTILFFAFTGALQLFSLHEAHDGYEPPVLIERLGRLHKDQTLALRPKRPLPKPARVAASGDWVAPAKAKHDDDDDAPPAKVTALKWLFLAAAVMLIVSTLLGLWMAFTQNRRKVVLLVIFILGAVAPAAILLLL